MTIVYRVEHKESCVGPFQEWWDEDNGFRRPTAIPSWRCDPNRHPMPWQDGLGFYHENRVFGCERLCDVLRWFGPERDLLLAAGFVMRVFDVPPEHIRHGGKQVTFDRSRAVLQSTVEFRPESEAWPCTTGAPRSSSGLRFYDNRHT